MSRETIRQLAREAAEEAAKEGKQPMAVWPEDIEAAKNGHIKAIQGIPFLGDYVPAGFERVNLQPEYDMNSHGIYMGDNEGFGAYMVDSSGFGSVGESALTIDEFIDRLTPGYWAVVEAGQFQVKVGKFNRVKK